MRFALILALWSSGDDELLGIWRQLLHVRGAARHTTERPCHL